MVWTTQIESTRAVCDYCGGQGDAHLLRCRKITLPAGFRHSNEPTWPEIREAEVWKRLSMAIDESNESLARGELISLDQLADQ